MIGPERPELVALVAARDGLQAPAPLAILDFGSGSGRREPQASAEAALRLTQHRHDGKCARLRRASTPGVERVRVQDGVSVYSIADATLSGREETQ
jgi:hypothetical protein